MKEVKVAVAGGGRWARQYVSLLLEHRDLLKPIVVVSTRNAPGMLEWIDVKGLATRDIKICSRLEDCPSIDAAIVVNSPADHMRTAAHFLRAGVPVLVEKPFTLSAEDARNLIELANQLDVYLAAAHVFKFARYLDRFAEIVTSKADIESVTVTWADMQDENRHGERKIYDPSVPVIADVLPHVLSMLDTLFPGKLIAYRSLVAARGGAQVDIALSLGRINCAAHLARNADKRTRSIEAIAGGWHATLDFSREPGHVVLNGQSQSADPSWNEKPRPLTSLVSTYLTSISTGERDGRLDARLGLLACEVTDQALAHYDLAVLEWLRATVAAGTAGQPDLDYATKEIGAVDAGMNGRESRAASMRLIDELRALENKR